MDNYEAYIQKNIDVIRAHLRYDSFKYQEGSRSYTGGKLICIHCNKEYTWKDWGKGKSKALTMAMKHLSNKHDLPYFVFSPPLFRKHRVFWLAFPEAE